MFAYQDEEQRYIFICIINTCKKQGLLHYSSGKKSSEENIASCLRTCAFLVSHCPVPLFTTYI